MPPSAEVSLKLIQQRTAFQSIPQDHVYAYLARAADGVIDMDVDGSGGDESFDYVVPRGTDFSRFRLSRLDVVLVDGSIRWGQFGGLGAALTNGLLFEIMDVDGVVQQNFGTGQRPIQTNEDFIALAGADAILILAAGDDAFPVRFSIFKSGNFMTMFPGWTFRVTVRDNLSGLTAFRMMVQGVLLRKKAAVLAP
jgi:hypothetical protein